MITWILPFWISETDVLVISEVLRTPPPPSPSGIEVPHKELRFFLF